jgi:hypothetical protein
VGWDMVGKRLEREKYMVVLKSAKFILIVLLVFSCKSKAKMGAMKDRFSLDSIYWYSIKQTSVSSEYFNNYDSFAAYGRKNSDVLKKISDTAKLAVIERFLLSEKTIAKVLSSQKFEPSNPESTAVISEFLEFYFSSATGKSRIIRVGGRLSERPLDLKKIYGHYPYYIEGRRMRKQYYFIDSLLNNRDKLR